MRANRAKKNSGGTKIFIVILILLIAIAGGLLAMKIIKERGNTQNVDSNNVIENVDSSTLIVEEKKPKTFAGDVRPIAVMIDNHIRTCVVEHIKNDDYSDIEDISTFFKRFQ